MKRRGVGHNLLDVYGSANPIPLSPQWLLPKPGDKQPGNENNFTLYPGYASRSDVAKSSGNSEEMHDSQKRKDVFRPSVLAMDSGRRDRWRDEERDTNSSVSRDRWREGDKELGDTRKVDRWSDNSSARYSGEARRGPSERWTDFGNRETNQDQRHGSKWNTRWGPDDKEADGLRDKWTDYSKDTDIHIDKGFSHLTQHAEDDREGDHYRPWKSNANNREKWNLLIAQLQHQANRGLHLCMVEAVGRMVCQLSYTVGEGLALVEAL
ncbi:protein ESSENTIAL FOR POTEXVIRUS ACCUMULATION 1-like isoform X2 [Actinidia eriantha]|uniref:protein ESSENTIAL FOR POTEXVIRUS ACCUMULATION 1-like isoform X2 n=1 Tax=Actinidia eriantha TaxID=165200 RepID=UPI00258D2290|nr:protein ESSENTIAL FOR POTEXVIRUS ACCUMULATION 1-like isoform X2 [Actinidia eriantha]